VVRCGVEWFAVLVRARAADQLGEADGAADSLGAALGAALGRALGEAAGLAGGAVDAPGSTDGLGEASHNFSGLVRSPYRA
jgi:hypothetical protein